MKENSVKKTDKEEFDLNLEVYLASLLDGCCYHPQVDAISNCEHCAEPICAKCRFIYRGDVILDIPDEELCFRCYADKTKLNRIFEFVMNCVFIFNFVSFITVLFLLLAYEIWGA